MDQQSRFSARFQLQAAIREDFERQIRASSVELHAAIQKDLLKQADDDDASSDQHRAAAIQEDPRKQIDTCSVKLRTAVRGRLRKQTDARLVELRAAVQKDYRELMHTSMLKLRDTMPDDDLRKVKEEEEEEEEEGENALRKRISACSTKLRAAAQEDLGREIVGASSEARLRAAIREDLERQILVRLRGRRRTVAVKDDDYDDDADDDDPRWSAAARRRRAFERQFREVGDRIVERLVRLESRLDGLEDQLKRLSR
jgi:hypothetical protein